MTILKPDGTPAPMLPEQKLWKDMDADEKLDVLRQGIAHLIQVSHMTAQHVEKCEAGVSKMIAALEESAPAADATTFKTQEDLDASIHADGLGKE